MLFSDNADIQTIPTKSRYNMSIYFIYVLDNLLHTLLNTFQFCATVCLLHIDQLLRQHVFIINFWSINVGCIGFSCIIFWSFSYIAGPYLYCVFELSVIEKINYPCVEWTKCTLFCFSLLSYKTYCITSYSIRRVFKMHNNEKALQASAGKPEVWEWMW